MTQEIFMENHGELIQNTLIKSEQVKAEQDLLKALKDKLHDNLVNAGLDRIVTDQYKIMIVGESRVNGINLKSVARDEPELYVRLLNDYLKVTARKSYVKVEYLS